jgi:hypothetical protein
VKQLSKTKKTSKCEKRSVWLITCCPLALTTQPYLYNSTLFSLQRFKPTPISLQLDLWLIWTLSHNLYLFELITLSYSDSNSTWSPPQPNFQLNGIPHPWTLLGSILAYPILDSSLLELKVLIPLWIQTPSQFELVFSIFFLNSSGQLTWITFTLSAYPISPDWLTWTLSEQLITSMLSWPYMFISSRITLLDSSPDRTSTYPALHGLTRPN